MLPYRTHHFDFLLLDGFSNMVLASAMEPLRDVQMRSIDAGLSWRITTLDGAPAISSSGLKMTPDGVFDETRRDETLVLVAGYIPRAQITPQVLARIRQAVRTAEQVIAIDGASWILAEAGVLDGFSATVHWQDFDAFTEAFPSVNVSPSRYVRSGKFITSGGASSVMDLFLDLIGERFGPTAAFEASTMFQYDPFAQSARQSGPMRLRNRGSATVLSALDAMVEHIETPLSTQDLARHASVSERTLNRVFLQELGITPGKYYQMLRLQRARYLAEETPMPLDQVALRCGFSSASALGRAFASAYGLRLGDLRRRGPQRAGT